MHTTIVFFFYSSNKYIFYYNFDEVHITFKCHTESRLNNYICSYEIRETVHENRKKSTLKLWEIRSSASLCVWISKMKCQDLLRIYLELKIKSKSCIRIVCFILVNALAPLLTIYMHYVDFMLCSQIIVVWFIEVSLVM